MNFSTLLQAALWTLLLQLLLLPSSHPQFELRSVVPKPRPASAPQGIIQADSDRSLSLLQTLWTLTNQRP